MSRNSLSARNHWSKQDLTWMKGNGYKTGDVCCIIILIHDRLKCSRSKICRTRPLASLIWDGCIDFSDAV